MMLAVPKLVQEERGQDQERGQGGRESSGRVECEGRGNGTGELKDGKGWSVTKKYLYRGRRKKRKGEKE